MADHLDISDEVRDFFENKIYEPDTAEGQPAAEAQEPVEGEEEAQEGSEGEEVVEGAEEGTETAESEGETELEGEEEQPEGEEEGEEEDESELHPAEKRRREQQAQYDRKIATMEQQLAQMNEWAQQQYAWQQQLVQEERRKQEEAQQSAQLHVSQEQVDAALQNDLRGTYQWVAMNRPDLMPYIVGKAREDERYGHSVADQMLVEFQQFQMQRQQAQFEEQRQVQEAPAQVESTMLQILTSLEGKHGETFTAMKDQISEAAAEAGPAFFEYMSSNGYEVTPQTVADFISQVYLDLREQNINKAAAKPRGPQKLTPQQHVENPGAQQGNQTTPNEDAINELLKGARSLGIEVSASA